MCLFHLVANEEKFFLRYDDGKQNVKWEFKLDLGTEGGKTLYNRLTKNKTIKSTMVWNMNQLTWSPENDSNFLSFLETDPSKKITFDAGDMLASLYNFIISSYHSESNYQQIIGNLIEPNNLFDMLKELKIEGKALFINLEFVYEPDNAPKIAELNKKIIIIFIIGLSILIVIFIIKFIV